LSGLTAVYQRGKTTAVKRGKRMGRGSDVKDIERCNQARGKKKRARVIR